MFPASIDTVVELLQVVPLFSCWFLRWEALILVLDMQSVLFMSMILFISMWPIFGKPDMKLLAGTPNLVGKFHSWSIGFEGGMESQSKIICLRGHLVFLCHFLTSASLVLRTSYVLVPRDGVDWASPLFVNAKHECVIMQHQHQQRGSDCCVHRIEERETCKICGSMEPHSRCSKEQWRMAWPFAFC